MITYINFLLNGYVQDTIQPTTAEGMKKKKDFICTDRIMADFLKSVGTN